ncbi:MAG: zinc-finger domain-containing protein [Hyphomicrobiaceae bacterium]
MATGIVPNFANDDGVDRVKVGVRELNCMGARPPYDHPHVYLDMGVEREILCPYCSTVFEHDDNLSAVDSIPPGCIVALQGVYDEAE